MAQPEFNYLPWTGSKYTDGINGKRILIVGESFYKDRTYSDMSLYHPSSEEAINKYLGGMKQKTLDNLTSILTGLIGEELTQDVKESLWDHVMMYNFIQDYLREGPQDKSRFPIDSIRAGKQLLLKVLETYNPDLVVICSQQIWKYYDGLNYYKHCMQRNYCKSNKNLL